MPNCLFTRWQSGKREFASKTTSWTNIVQSVSCGVKTMTDTMIKKVEAKSSPVGEMGQKYLTLGKAVSLRLWDGEIPGAEMPVTRREYETVGYVIAGRAELHLEGQTIKLAPGDSWLVPKGAEHQYRILEPFTAVEATAPPAQAHGRDTI
jgi:quercetin dioxygenase-like cupin family protein